MRAVAQAKAEAASKEHGRVNEKVSGAFGVDWSGLGGDGGVQKEARPHLEPLDAKFEREDRGSRPPISAHDVTLTLQFPAIPVGGGGALPPPFLSSSEALTAQIRQRYGPVEHVVLREGKLGERKKGGKAIVEFKTQNWDGCWACWRDHQEGGGLVPGTKVKWAGGGAPAWVAWAEMQESRTKQSSMASSTPSTTPSFASNSHRPPGPASSFPAFGVGGVGGTSAASTPTMNANGKDDLESTTLLRMRQLERERMAERMRREEEEEG